MSWIEIIKVALGSREVAEILPDILSITSSDDASDDLQTYVLTRGDYAGEVMVILVWDISKESERKSAPAWLLLKALGAFGLTDYSCWRDTEGMAERLESGNAPANEESIEK